MPMLPKVPSLLLHFDKALVDYYEDVPQDVSFGGTIDSRLYISSMPSLKQKTFFLDNANIRINDNSSLDISKTFTVRFWEYYISGSSSMSTNNSISFSCAYNGTNGGLSIGNYSAGSTPSRRIRVLNSSNAQMDYDVGTVALDINKWVHWEICYDTSTKRIYIFKNGILLHSVILTTNPYFNASYFTFINGTGNNATSTKQAMYADFEFIAGVCEHTADFDPPPITSRQITASLNPMVTDVNSKFGSKSLSLSGATFATSNYLVSNAALLDTRNDFTISFWEYLVTSPINSFSMAVNGETGVTGANANAAILLGYNVSSNKTVTVRTSSAVIASNIVLESVANVLNKWIHWEICYSAATKLLYVFLNGNLKYAVICPESLKNNGKLILNGWTTTSQYSCQTAYYDELLILPDVCLHQSNFTPPDEPYTLPEQELTGRILQAPSSGSQSSPVADGNELKVLNSGINVPAVCDGVIIDIVKGYQNLRTLFGKPISPLVYGNQLQPTFAGVEMYMSAGTRSLAQYNGISIEFLYPDSNAGYNFDLLVTPTHIYKNQFAHVIAKYKLPQGLTGEYQLKIKDQIVIPWGASTDISTVAFNIMQSMLEYGKNPCRLEYLYPDGQFKFLDFEVTREESKRTRVERTFKSYDGGYDGDYMRSAPGSLRASCFLVPDGQESTLIKTTDFTKVSLQKYTGVQGVQIDAEGAMVLVTFDNGLTWKALINNSWQTVSLDNIATDGMTPELVNSVIFARWLQIFQPASLDFAVYLDKNINNYVDLSKEQLIYSINQLSGGTYIVDAPDKYGITKFSIDAYYTNATVSLYKKDNLLETIKIAARDYGEYNLYRPDRITFRVNGGYLINGVKVFAAPHMHYLKSIVADITPRLKTGYAFIM